MENKPIHNDRFDALLYNALFPNMQTQKKAAYEDLFILIDHVLDKGASISLQISKDGSMNISCIPMEGTRS